MRLFAAMLLGLALTVGGSHAATPAQADRARQCGISERVVQASLAAQPTLVTLDARAGFADRGAGPIRLIEFADYSCPACRTLHPRLVAFANNNPDVRISVVEYPTYGRTLISRATGNKTLDASRIAVAAGAQGKQLAFHDALMTTPGQVNAQSIARAAQRAGVDLAAAEAAANSPAMSAKVEGSLAVAKELGLEGTPHVVVDGVLVSLEPGWGFEQVTCLVEKARVDLKTR